MTEISNEWGGNAIMQQSIQRWTLNLNWSDKKNLRQRIDTVVLK